MGEGAAINPTRRVVNGVRTRIGREDYGTLDAETTRDDEELMQDMAAHPQDFHSAGHTTGADTNEDATPEVAQVRAQIEETRSSLTETIDAIKEKLSPAHLVEEAKEATIGKAQSAVSGVVESVKEKAADVVDAAKDLYHSAADKVTGRTHMVPAEADFVPGSARAYAPPFRGVSQPNLGATIVETIKVNPVPAAIAGFGLGWLLISMQRQQNSGVRRTYDTGYDNSGSYPIREYPDNSGAYGVANAGSYGTTAYGTYNTPGQQFGTAVNNGDNGPSLKDRASDIAHSVGDKASDLAQNLSSKASDLKDTVSSKASDLKDSVSDWAGGVRDSASQFKDRAGDTVHNLADQTRQQVGVATDTTTQFINDQPLAAAGIALALGLLVGIALPSTETENQIIGPKRDRLIDQGKDAAQNVAQKVQGVASVALNQAKDTLSQTVSQTKDTLSHTVDDAKQQLQQAVQQTKDTVVKEAQNQGLTSPATAIS